MKKKVLIIISNFNAVGGAETATQRFLRKIDKNKIELDICFFGYEDEFVLSLKKDVSQVFCFDIKKDGYIKTYLKLLKLLKKEKYEIIHTHLALADFYGLSLAILAPFKWISTEHNLSDRRKVTALGRIYYRLARRRVYKIVGVSSKVIGWLKTAGVPGEKLVMIPNPIEIIQESAKVAKKSDLLRVCGWPEGVKIICAIANLRPVKGLEYLIDSIKILIRAGKPVRLVITGEGPQRSSLEKLIEMNQLSGYVKLLGYIKDVYNMLPLFDMYVSASLMEGFGISIVEAMSCRLPVVATAVGGVTDFLRHMGNAYLVRPRDPYELAIGISYFLENENQARKISECAFYDTKLYETAKLIKYIEQLYLGEPQNFATSQRA